MRVSCAYAQTHTTQRPDADSAGQKTAINLSTQVCKAFTKIKLKILAILCANSLQ